jgi:hypothetical protein
VSGTLPASYNSPVDFRISQSPPVINNLTDANQAIADIYACLQQVIRTFVDIGGIGQQTSALWPALNGTTRGLTEGNTRRLICRATENILFGAIISLIAGGDGIIQARNANATNNTRIADGYCSTIGGIVAGSLGEVILGTGVVNISGVIVGQRYWLSTISGLISNVPALGAGNVEQLLGIGIDPLHIWFSCGMWLQH